MNGTLVIAGAVTVMVTYGLAVWLRQLGLRHGLLDHPNHRSLHAAPVPRVGGLALLTGAAVGILILRVDGLPSPPLGGWVPPLVALAVVGAIDDVRSLSPSLRLSMQLAAAVWLLTTLRATPVADALGFLLALSAVIWLVGLTNAYNFMDGVDGIAGGQAVVASVGWAVLGRFAGDAFLVGTGVVIAAASGGFLVLNWRPARLFMGDVGSTVLGYWFAMLTVLAWVQDRTMALAGVALVWPFLFDSLFTCFRRIQRGENVLRPHRSHLYQRLVAAGWRHDRVAILYGLMAATSGTAGIAAWRANRILIALPILGLLGILLWRLVVTAERQTRLSSPSVL